MTVTHDPLGTLPPQAAKVFAEIGPVWGSDINKHRDFVIATYSPIVAAADNSGIRVERDIAYGPHPRQVLDVFMPAPGAGTAPPRDVVIFVHGGAFIRGKKSVDAHIYDNVCY